MLFDTVLPAIGLVVGAMGIMNIMLVAVAKRTREIGVRKALGARKRDSMSQFLVESATLSVFGAALGIALGIGLAAIIAVYHTTGGFLENMDGRGPDKPRAIFPMLFAYRHLNLYRRRLRISVKPRAEVLQSWAMDAGTAMLRAKHGLEPGANNFAVVAQDRVMETFDQLFGAIFMVGLALSAVALLVGGGGVVAIMMISVTERAREIGVRKALGATRAILLWQFLVEAATLTSLGAGIGLLIGAILAGVIEAYTPLPASVPASAMLSAVGARLITGIIFGMLPALRASRPDPIDALRHE